MTDKRVHIRGSDMTLAEELHFIHDHIEAIDASIESIHEALKALTHLVQTIVDTINEEAIEPDG